MREWSATAEPPDGSIANLLVENETNDLCMN